VEAEEEEEDDEAPDDVGLDEEPAGEDPDEGAVGNSKLVLFENWQPASSTAATVVAAQAQIFFIMSVYTFVCAHTVLVRAVNSHPGRSGKTTDATASVQESCQGSRDAYADMDPPGTQHRNVDRVKIWRRDRIFAAQVDVSPAARGCLYIGRLRPGRHAAQSTIAV
jgi:hypothetical protein